MDKNLEDRVARLETAMLAAGMLILGAVESTEHVVSIIGNAAKGLVSISSKLIGPRVEAFRQELHDIAEAMRDDDGDEDGDALRLSGGEALGGDPGAPVDTGG